MSEETSWLLQISVGPVQKFIAATRRTRDLWFGSSMLSEISKAAAKAVKDAGAELIFPEPNGDLRPKSDLNVANVIRRARAQLPAWSLRRLLARTRLRVRRHPRRLEPQGAVEAGVQQARRQVEAPPDAGVQRLQLGGRGPVGAVIHAHESTLSVRLALESCSRGAAH